MNKLKALWARVRPWLVPELELDENGDLRRIRRAGFIIIGIFFVGFGLWAILAPLAGAVIAPGVVKVDMNRKTVQHQEGGIVKQILVRDGQKVVAGQPLVVLDDVRVDASLVLLQQQYDAQIAKIARLAAENALRDKVEFPQSLLARKNDEKVAEVLAREQSLFDARKRQLFDQVRLYQSQIVDGRKESAALVAQVKAEEHAAKLQREELGYNQKLLEQGFVQKTRVMTLERALAEYESRAAEHSAEHARTNARVTDLDLRIVSAKNNYMQTAANELTEATQRLYDIEERLRPSLDAQQRQSITSPIAGEVVDLHVFTEGAVVGPRDPLMDIVPLNTTLIIEAPVQVQDIAYIHVGSEVEVRLTAYSHRTTPMVDGKVIYISADRLVDKGTGVPFYRTHVAVTPESLKEAGDLQLQAGMPAEIYITTAQRTPLDYWLEPVTAYLRKAWREH